MARCLFLVPFAVFGVVLYTAFTTQTYWAYMRSFSLRSQFRNHFNFQKQNPPKWQWEAMKDEITTNYPPKNKTTTVLSKNIETYNNINNNNNNNIPKIYTLSSNMHKDHVGKTNRPEDNKILQNTTGYDNVTRTLKPKPHVQSKLTAIPVMFKKDFKKMPRWEFHDEYLRSSESFHTVCAESLQKTKDPDFQKAFIPNVQMHLYQNLLNLSEWNRLSHFNNPYGFMEYNYSDIKDVVDLIPKPHSARLLPVPENDSCIHCAVVGTSGILNGSKMGKEIDSHTYVFRMNGAVLEGYEEDVGTKTSVYVHTAYSVVASLSMFKKYGMRKIPHDEGIKYVMIPEGQRDFQWLQGLLTETEVAKGQFRKLKPWTYYAEKFNVSNFYVLHPDFLRYVRNRFMTSKQQDGKHWALYRPTNGAFALFLALHVCDTVDAYGFITEHYQKYSTYYFEKQKTRVQFFINHDYNLEKKLWKKLHDAKILTLYQGNEGQR